MADELSPIRQGGTGSQSELDEQPATLPDRFESGNHNVPGILGLGAGLTFLAEEGLEAIAQREHALLERLVDGLSACDGVTLQGPRDTSRRCGLVSVTVGGYDAQEVAAMLDTAASIQVRGGLHCAPGVHRALGTLATGGTVRFSLGPFNTREDVEAVVESVGQLAATTSGIRAAGR